MDSENLRKILISLKVEDSEISAGEAKVLFEGTRDVDNHSTDVGDGTSHTQVSQSLTGNAKTEINEGEYQPTAGEVEYSFSLKLEELSKREALKVSKALDGGDLGDAFKASGDGRSFDNDSKVTEIYSSEYHYHPAGGENKILPEALMEKIISRIPFPRIFKAKVLSRSWFFKLPSLLSVRSISSYEQVEDFHSNSWFHLEISKASQNWPSYCPVFVWNRRIFGFEQTSCQWMEIPIHHEIPMPQRNHERIQSANVHFAGSLMIYYRPDEEESTSAFVANPLTGSWTVLPGFPNVYQCLCIFKKQSGRGQYNMVIVNAEWYSAGSLRVTTRTLDSQSRTWHSEESFLGTMVDDVTQFEEGTFASYFGPSSAYLNGKVYIVLWGERVEIWEFGIERRSWKIVHLNLTPDPDPSPTTGNQFRNYGVYVVGCELYLVVLTGFMSDEPVIYQLDIKTLQPVPLRRWECPWKMQGTQRQQRHYCDKVIGGSTCLFFLRERFYETFRTSIWSFEVGTGTWMFLPFPQEYAKTFIPENLSTGIYEPGLNPFIVP